MLPCYPPPPRLFLRMLHLIFIANWAFGARYMLDSECCSTWKYCNNKGLNYLCHSLDRFIKSEKRLMHILSGKHWLSSHYVKEAVRIVESCLPSGDADQSDQSAQQPTQQPDTLSESDSVNVSDLPRQVAENRHETRNIFNFQDLKDIVNELDFDSPN